MAKSVQEMVLTLKQGYMDRDITKIDSFMNTIFQNKEDIIVIGTSPGELKVGVEESKKLFISDFLHWNNVLIDDQNVIIKEIEDVSWVIVNAKIVYEFSDSENTMKNFYDEMKYVSGFDTSNLQKGTEMVWLLSHLLHSRLEETREYLWDLQIHMLVVKKEEEYVCKMLLFDIPTTFDKTDVMMDNSSKYIKRDENTAINATVFHKLEQAVFEDVMQEIHQALKKKLKTVDTISLPKNHFLIQKFGNQYSFYGTAILTDAWTIEERLEQVIIKIQEHKFGDNLKNALYRIRRDISYYLWRYAKGSDTEYPVRYIGVFEVKDEKVTIVELKVSFPFEVILEEKFD